MEQQIANFIPDLVAALVKGVVFIAVAVPGLLLVLKKISLI
jgi:hypothetical protein